MDARPAVANGLSSSGLSGTGPSHKSVLMLSSETFLSITFPPSGDLDGRVTVVLGGVLLRRLPKSSWKMGILKAVQNAPLLSYMHRVEIEGWEQEVGEAASTADVGRLKAGRRLGRFFMVARAAARLSPMTQLPRLPGVIKRK